MSLFTRFTLSSESRRQLRHSDPRWRLKLNIHIVNIVFSLVSISLFAAAIPSWNLNFFHATGPSPGDWTDGISIGPLAFSCLCSICSVLSCLLYKRHAPGPKAAIILTGLVILALAPSLFLAGFGSLFRFWQPSFSNETGGLTCTMSNIFARECDSILYKIGELQLAGLVFGSLVWMVQILLFLFLWSDAFRTVKKYDNTHKRHHRRSQGRRYKHQNNDEMADTAPIVRIKVPMASRPPVMHRYY